MQIDEQLLQRLEKLSALKLEDSEKEKALKDLEEILKFSEIMNEVKLDGLKDSLSISDSYTPFRADIPIKSDAKDIIFANTKVEDDYFIVPKIIE